VILRGVPFLDNEENLATDLRGEVEEILTKAAAKGIRDIPDLQQALHDDLAKFVYDRLKRRPMVLPVVVEV
jgi:ribonuclease J